MKNFLSILLNIVIVILLILLLFQKCERRVISERTYIIKSDTVYKVDTLEIERAKEYVKVIIKRDTIEKERVKYDTFYTFNLYKYTYKDTIVKIEFLANYVDTTSIRYEILKKPKQLPIYKNNIITLYTKGDLNSYGLIYQKRIFHYFFMGVLLEKDYRDFKIGVSFSYQF
ncbi:MAG: hypothetical protein RMJ67_01305 [Elusimicrobiota bacterium]|nr:hypothetical protein [Endomicrobiia bacterium]MDW8165141.1 hypothetical protein [Elusimicrobiota bacterium]